MESESKITLMIIGGGILMVLFSLLVALVINVSKRKVLENENKLQLVEKKKQLELFWATAQAEENEKTRIASDLHDEVAPVLALTSRNLYNQVSQLEKQGYDLTELKKELDSFAGLSSRIREIAHGLIPQLFTTFGLIKSIEVIVKKINTAADADAEFIDHTQGKVELPLQKNQQLLVYRICLEVLNNITKHSGFDYLKVSISIPTNNMLIVEFAHDGRGITNEEYKKLLEEGGGLGLKSMHSRALVLNAVIDYHTDPGVSYVKLSVPLNT